MFTDIYHCSLSRDNWAMFTPLSSISQTLVLILSSHQLLYVSGVFGQRYCTHFSSPHACYMSVLSHSFWSYHLNTVKWVMGIQIFRKWTKLLLFALPGACHVPSVCLLLFQLSLRACVGFMPSNLIFVQIYVRRSASPISSLYEVQ